MSAQVNGDSGPAVRRGPVDPASVPPQPRMAVESLGALRHPAASVAVGNGRAVPEQAVVPATAGVVTRLLAAAVDAVVVVLLAALLDLAAAGARFLWSPVDFRWPRPTVATTVGALLLIAVVYLAAAWALTGRTYGSRLMGLRVLSSRRHLLGWTRSIVRALICVAWPLGLIWCAISRTRASVADLVLRTVVVYDARPYAPVPGRAPRQ